MATHIEISYAAHTASCTFLLDDEGICRRIVVAPKGKRREGSRTAVKCLGAQYVASLDGCAAGGLVEMPRVGAAMLFARVDENGRVSLVRTGVVTSFESHAGEDPFVDSQSVETSAPALDHLAPPRSVRQAPPRDPDYFDPSDRTQRLPALRPEHYASYGDEALDEDPFERTSEPANESGNDLATAEYQSTSESDRPTLPPQTLSPTLRKPHREAAIEGNDSYARPAPSPSRGVLPRRSVPKVAAASNAAHAWAPESERTPPAYGSDVQLTRRRGGS